MSIETREEFRRLQEAGRIVRETLVEMKKNVRPGVTTDALSRIGAAVLKRNGARSAPMLVYNFPGAVCISVNDEIVHGIPSERTIKAGDLVKLDVVAEKDGYMADAAMTVAVGAVSEKSRRLIECARRAFYKAMEVARAGNRLGEIGRAVEAEVRRSGFSVVRELSGHGIGRSIHEEPTVLNYYDAGSRQRLAAGMVIAVEPLVAIGSGKAVQMDDGWTIKTADGGLAAHYEHTIVITRGEPVILTAA